jgi:hypothetical protein
MGLNEIWYGSYSIAIYPKILPLSFLQPAIPTWREKIIFDVGPIIAPPNYRATQ